MQISCHDLQTGRLYHNLTEHGKMVDHLPYQVKAKMDSATNSGESLLGAHFTQMHEIVQGELLVLQSELCLHCLVQMLRHVLCHLIYLTGTYR